MNSTDKKINSAMLYVGISNVAASILTLLAYFSTKNILLLIVAILFLAGFAVFIILANKMKRKINSYRNDGHTDTPAKG